MDGCCFPCAAISSVQLLRSFATYDGPSKMMTELVSIQRPRSAFSTKLTSGVCAPLGSKNTWVRSLFAGMHDLRIGYIDLKSRTSVFERVENELQVRM